MDKAVTITGHQKRGFFRSVSRKPRSEDITCLRPWKKY